MISIICDGRGIDKNGMIEKCGLLKYKGRQWNSKGVTKLTELELKKSYQQ